MRNIVNLQIETKISLTIIVIVIIIFLATLFKGMDNFNKFINRLSSEDNYNEEIRLEKNP